jgi:hypothetical protein
MIDLSGAVWRKARPSVQATGGCVEVASNLPGITAVRDSKTPQGGAHVVGQVAFDAFIDDARAGKFDLI